MGKIRNANFREALKNAIKGLIYGIKTQRNMKIQLIITILVIIVAIIFKVSKIELLFLVLTIFILLVAEMINTSIEEVVNLYTEKFHDKAKFAKDIAAGAVLLASINSIIVAIIIFYDKIL